MKKMKVCAAVKDQNTRDQLVNKTKMSLSIFRVQIYELVNLIPAYIERG